MYFRTLLKLTVWRSVVDWFNLTWYCSNIQFIWTYDTYLLRSKQNHDLSVKTRKYPKWYLVLYHIIVKLSGFCTWFWIWCLPGKPESYALNFWFTRKLFTQSLHIQMSKISLIICSLVLTVLKRIQKARRPLFDLY